MKVTRNEYGYNILYEVDDFSSFNSDKELTIDDFEKLPHKKVAFVNEDYELFIIELNKKDSFYKYNSDCGIVLLNSGTKYFEINWNDKFSDIMNDNMEDYEIEMLDNIRKNSIRYFTTQF